MLRDNKFGQISIFVVIGVILIVIFSFMYFNSSFKLIYSPTAKYEKQVNDVVVSCSEESLKSGIFFLESNGGYIDSSPTNSVKGFLPGSISWDSYRGVVPTIESMSEDLSNFVKENSESCIKNGLSSLEDVMDLSYDYNQFNGVVEIKDFNVDLSISFPINFSVKNSDINSLVDSFSVSYDSSLGSLFSLAKEIYNLEDDQNIFEELVIDQISSAKNYNDIETSMPLSGSLFSCSPRIWTKGQLMENLFNLNNNNFKFIQFVGTFPKDEIIDLNLGKDSELKKYYESFYKFDLKNKKSSYKNYFVEVFMPSEQSIGINSYLYNYPFREFEVTPSNGDIVKSVNFNIGFKKMTFGCIQIFAHSYTLDYDLLVTIRDLSGDYNDFFNFPIRVELDKNQPKRNTNFLNSLETATKKAFKKDAERFCSEEDRIYPVEVTAEDYETGDLLNGVNISFKCLNLACDLGQTKREVYVNDELGLNYEYGEPILKSKVSYCYGGRFKGKKEGYFQIPVEERFPDGRDIDFISEDDPFYGRIYMLPTKKFDLRDSYSAYTIDSCSLAPKSKSGLYINIVNEKIGFDEMAILGDIADDIDFNQFSSIDLPVSNSISYNVSAYFIIDEELYGLFQIENWKPDVFVSDNIFVNIPLSSKKISSLDEGELRNYIDYVNSLNSSESSSCSGIMPKPFGINLY